MKKFAIAFLTTVVALSAWAQDQKTVGKLANVTGLVTISRGGQLANATNGGPLVVGSRIISTSTGGATLKFDNGCDVTLKANESFTVSENKDCSVLLAGVSPVVTPAGVPAAVSVAGSSGLAPVLIFTASSIGVVVASNVKNKTSGS